MSTKNIRGSSYKQKKTATTAAILAIGLLMAILFATNGKIFDYFSFQNDHFRLRRFVCALAARSQTLYKHLREYHTMLLTILVVVHTDHKNLIYPTETNLRAKNAINRFFSSPTCRCTTSREKKTLKQMTSGKCASRP